VIPALGQGRNATDLGQPPKEVKLPTKDPIVQLAGGAYHSIVLTRSKNIYTFGAGQLGQLGRPTTAVDASGLPVDPTPALVAGIPSTETVEKIGSGFYNTLAACQSGALYCAGENQNLQCGNSSGLKNLREMTIVKEVEGVESAQGGYCHTLIKTVAGKVLSMGCGDEGQRGVGQPAEEDVELQLPIVSSVDLPGGQKATQVAAGANHSVILGENGVAYTFGANDMGQCGVVSSDDGDDDDEGGPVWAPKAVEIPGKVVEVSAGYAHTVLTTSTGRVFTFGQNDNGQLGIGRKGVEKGEDCGPSMSPVEVKLESG
jgi:alpha-tubulin suppressor-like RCC1 family protein